MMRNATARSTRPTAVLIAGTSLLMALGCPSAPAQAQQPPQQTNLFGYDAESFERHLQELSFDRYWQEQRRLNASPPQPVQPPLPDGSSRPPHFEGPADLDDDL